MTERQQLDAMWRVEAVHVLMWALKLVPELLPYDVQAKVADADAVAGKSKTAGLVADAHLREPAEVNKARDIAELWHWRSRTRQLMEEGPPFKPTEEMTRQGFRSYDDIVRVTARKASADRAIPTAIAEDFPAKSKAYRDLAPEEWAEVRVARPLRPAS